VLGHEIPAGELVTLPLPLTVTDKVSTGPCCVIVAGPSSPDDPKLTYKLPDRVSPVFAATVYGVVHVISTSSGSGLGEHVVELTCGVIQLTVDCRIGLPQSSTIVKVHMAFQVPPPLGKLVV